MARRAGLGFSKGVKGPVLIVLASYGKEVIDWIIKHRREIKDFLLWLHGKARNWWNGKKVAVIGPPAVGKDSFFHRLRGEALPKQPVQTKGTSKWSTFTFKRTLPNGKPFRVVFKRCVNVGGESEEIRNWPDACKGADVIFYMITLDDLKNGKYRPDGRIYADLKWLATYIGGMKPNVAVHILVNKIDLDLVDGKAYEQLDKEVEPQGAELMSLAKTLFREYDTRLTGLNLTSMKDDYWFGLTFPAALDSVYRALHEQA